MPQVWFYQKKRGQATGNDGKIIPCAKIFELKGDVYWIVKGHHKNPH